MPTPKRKTPGLRRRLAVRRREVVKSLMRRGFSRYEAENIIKLGIHGPVITLTPKG